METMARPGHLPTDYYGISAAVEQALNAEARNVADALRRSSRIYALANWLESLRRDRALTLAETTRQWLMPAAALTCLARVP